MSCIAHVRTLWPRAWPLGLLAPLPFVLYPTTRLVGGRVRWELLAIMLLPPLLAYGTTATKKLFVGLYPIGLVGILYDAMKYVQNAGLDERSVHLCDLRDLELRLFGITWDGVRVTTHDWMQAHASPTADLYFAIPYATFIFATIGFVVFLWTRDFAACQRFAWGFFALNVVGFATYHLYPAAPPWYFHAHGCAVDLAAPASEGPNLARVDAWTGISYFRGMYGRSSDVYGAVPSLHVAYPLLIVLEGWRHLRWLGRALAILFALSMNVAAVYLDHHWIFDVVVGLSYGVFVFAVVNIVSEMRSPKPRSAS